MSETVASAGPSTLALSGTPVLATKLYLPPTRLALVPRPRLFEKLDQGLRGRLILVSAPAGFGKTTLLSSWVQAQASPAPAWAVGAEPELSADTAGPPHGRAPRPSPGSRWTRTIMIPPTSCAT